MIEAADRDGKDPGVPSSESRSLSEIEEHELTEMTTRQALQAERGAAIEKKRKATTWLVTLGFGPAAAVAVLLALFVEGSRDLAVSFGFLGALLLLLRVYREDRKIKKLEAELRDPLDGS